MPARNRALIAIVGCLLALPAASGDVLTFDTLSEGLLSQTLQIAGITFTNLDQRLALENADSRFTIDDSRASLSGRPGFSANNCLGFGAYAPGVTAGFFRLGSFDLIPTVPAVRATVEVFDRGEHDPGTTLNLEAYRNGFPVGIVTIPAQSGSGVHHTTLAYEGPAFDRLLLFVGPTDERVLYALVDGVSITSESACATDADLNGMVEPADVSLFISAWYGGVVAGTLAGDFDGSGTVTPADVALFVIRWMSEVSGPCGP